MGLFFFLSLYVKLEQAAVPKKKVEVPVEAKVGDLVELFVGKGQVRAVREDGMLEVWAMGWEMAGEQRPRFYVQRNAVKVVPTVYYKMPGEHTTVGFLSWGEGAFSSGGGGEGGGIFFFFSRVAIFCILYLFGTASLMSKRNTFYLALFVTRRCGGVHASRQGSCVIIYFGGGTRKLSIEALVMTPRHHHAESYS